MWRECCGLGNNSYLCLLNSSCQGSFGICLACENAIFGKRLHRAALKAGTGIGIQFKKAEITADYDIDWRVSHISQTGKIALKYHF